MWNGDDGVGQRSQRQQLRPVEHDWAQFCIQRQVFFNQAAPRRRARSQHVLADQVLYVVKVGCVSHVMHRYIARDED